MGKKFKVAVFDKLLLEDGQIISFNTHEFALVFKNETYYVTVSHIISMYLLSLKLSKQEIKRIKKLRRVIAKVKIKCELIKK
jgi:hypothetical protein